MQKYSEHSGELVKKYRNIIGQYVLVIKDDGKNINVCVGKGLFDHYKIGQKITVGKVGRRLINIRPYK